MIDMTKKYTYQGKQVRIYADGSDTAKGFIHGAYLVETEWNVTTFRESDLVEVWEPKKGEIIFGWDEGDTLPALRLFAKGQTVFDNYAPFNGTLPEAFKGL